MQDIEGSYYSICYPLNCVLANDNYKRENYLIRKKVDINLMMVP